MDREEEIRLIAYHIWEGEGCVNGRDCEHWTQAVQIWESQKPQPAVKSKRKPASKTTRKTQPKKAK